MDKSKTVIYFLRTFIFTIVIAIIGLFLSPFFLNLNKLSQLLITEIEVVTGKNTIISGDINLSVNPLLNRATITIPKIIFQDKIKNDGENFLEAENLITQISLINFFQGKAVFNYIKFTDAKLNLTINQENRSDWDFYNYSLEKKKQIANLKVIEFTNTSVNLNSSGGIVNFPQTNITLHLNSDSSFDATGKLMIGQDSYLLDSNLLSIKNDSQDFSLSLKNSINNLGNIKLQGKYFPNNTENQFTGQLDGTFTSTSILLETLKPLFPFLEGYKGINLAIKDKIEIASKLTISGLKFNFEDLKILNSSDINIIGNFSFSIKNFLDIASNLSIEKLNLSNLFVSSEPLAPDSLDKTADHFLQTNKYTDITYLKNAIIDLKLSANQINLSNNSINNLHFYFLSDAGIVDQGYLNFTFIDNANLSKIDITKLQFSRIDSTDVLLGNFNFQTDNLNKLLKTLALTDYFSLKKDNTGCTIDSSLLLSSQELSIFDIDGEMNNKQNFNGIIAFKKQLIDEYGVDIKFNNSNIDDFNSPLLFERLNIILTQSQKDDYISNFRWFRTIPANFSLKFEFNDTNFVGNKIDNLNFNLRLEPGKFSLKSLIRADFAVSNIQLDLLVPSIKPIIDININADYLDFDRINPIITHIFNKTEDNDIKLLNEEWSSKSFNYFNIQKYQAKITSFAKKIKYNDNLIDLAALSAHTSNDILYIDNFYLGIFNGQFQSIGNITYTLPPVYQFSFTASDLETNGLISNTFPKLATIQGPISAKGSVTSKGDNPKDLIANIDFSGSIASANLTLNNIDADSVVDIALKRKELSANSVLSAIDHAFYNGTTNIVSMNGKIKGDNGVLVSDNIYYKSRFTSSSLSFILDLNNLNFTANSKFFFLTYDGVEPISFGISASGSIHQDLKKIIDDNNLLSYVKASYNIVTSEDIANLKEKAQKQNKPKDNPDDKEFLYQKILELNKKNGNLVNENNNQQIGN